MELATNLRYLPHALAAIRVGPIALTAHVTAGHPRGCTSWSFPVRDGDLVLNVVSVCDPEILATSQYPEQGTDRERSLRVLRSLPVDIWVTNPSSGVQYTAELFRLILERTTRRETTCAFRRASVPSVCWRS